MRRFIIGAVAGACLLGLWLILRPGASRKEEPPLEEHLFSQLWLETVEEARKAELDECEVRLLRDRTDTRAREALTKSAREDRLDGVRLYALELLLRSGEDDAFGEALTLAVSNTSARVRFKAAALLERVGGEAYDRWLRQVYGEGNGYEAFRRSRIRRTLEALERMGASDPSEAVRRAASRARGSLCQVASNELRPFIDMRVRGW